MRRQETRTKRHRNRHRQINRHIDKKKSNKNTEKEKTYIKKNQRQILGWNTPTPKDL